MLLNATPVIFPVLQKEVKEYPNRKQEVVKEAPRPDDAESAKEMVKDLGDGMQFQMCLSIKKLLEICVAIYVSFIYMQGNLAFKKKDFKAAIESYSEAIRCDEDNATYYSNRAAAYLALYK